MFNSHQSWKIIVQFFSNMIAMRTDISELIYVYFLYVFSDLLSELQYIYI